MLKLDTLQDIEALHDNRLQESSTLEYKASPAVGDTERLRLEIAKDVSAMANASGGQIIYGMTESNHLPAGLDQGVDPSKFNGLWLEQVIQQNVRPQIDRLHILSPPLSNGNVVHVVTVPAATARAPHQVTRDGRYYRRRNFRNDVMEDYEVRELMNRATLPELFVSLSFEDSFLQRFPTPVQSDITPKFPLIMKIGNKSAQPALYTIVRFYIDTRATLLHAGGMESLGETSASLGRNVLRLARRIGLPNGFPIFKEDTFLVSHPNFILQIPMISHGIPPVLLGYDVRTPGYQIRQYGVFVFYDPYTLGIAWDEPDLTPDTHFSS